MGELWHFGNFGNLGNTGEFGKFDEPEELVKLGECREPGKLEDFNFKN